MNLSLALSVAVFVLAIAAVVYVALNPPCEKFTEFYILGPGGKAADYPTELKVGQVGEVIVGVRNHQCETVTYRLVVLLGNETIYATEITLAHNQTWLYKLQFSPTQRGRTKLELLLYKNATETPHRTLHLWLDIK